MTSWAKLASRLCTADVFCLIAVLLALACCSCGSSVTGGGLPPGEPDVEGYVLAASQASGVTTAAAVASTRACVLPAQGWPPQGTPVPDCDVRLYRVTQVIASTRTDQSGRFEFRNVPTGEYEIAVVPPQGSGYAPHRMRFRHQHGRQTRLVIYLEPEAATK